MLAIPFSIFDSSVKLGGQGCQCMGVRRAASLCPQRVGVGAKSALLLSTDVIFSFSSYVCSSLRLDVLLSSAIHHLP